jgi:hypothetical protein
MIWLKNSRECNNLSLIIHWQIKIFMTGPNITDSFREKKHFGLLSNCIQTDNRLSNQHFYIN